MAITKIDTLMENLNEDYLRSVFADRLESTRLNVDDEAFGDITEAADAIRTFLTLTPEKRATEVGRVRIVAMVLNWANDEDVTDEDIASVITVLRWARDNKPQPEPEPEPEPEPTEGE